jgi:hypothetical protein
MERERESNQMLEIFKRNICADADRWLNYSENPEIRENNSLSGNGLSDF